MRPIKWRKALSSWMTWKSLMLHAKKYTITRDAYMQWDLFYSKIVMKYYIITCNELYKIHVSVGYGMLIRFFLFKGSSAKLFNTTMWIININWALNIKTFYHSGMITLDFYMKSMDIIYVTRFAESGPSGSEFGEPKFFLRFDEVRRTSK